MMAVVLAGGLGTRLRPYTMSIPKPLLPLGELPVMEIVLRQLATQGFTRVVITLGHLPHLVEAMLGDGTRFGLKIDYLIESRPLGTAGSLRLITDLPETFLVMNGDLLTTVDFAGLVASQQTSHDSGSILLARRRVAIDYGVVHVLADGRLSEYDEKPTLDLLVSTGIYALDRSVVEFVPDARYDMPDLMRDLMANGRPVRCVTTDAYWQDIGRFDDYQRASADFVADPELFLRASGDDHGAS
jgi:NDP-sugar pyrophosphorylase family protein